MQVHLRRRPGGQPDRFLRVMKQAQPVLLDPLHHAGGLLHRQGVDGQAVRRQLLYLLHSVLHLGQVLSGQPQDQIHVDVVKTLLPRQKKGLLHLLHRVSAADQIQGLLVHGLGIHGNPGHAEFLQHPQLVRRDAVRPAGLHGEFLHLRKIKGFPDPGKQASELIRLQCGGRSAAYVHAVQHLILKGFLYKIHFLFQRAQILLHPLPPGRNREGGEGAVQAGGRAEGNSDIQAVALFIMDVLQDFLLPAGDSDGKIRFFPAAVIGLFHIGADLLLRLTFLQKLHGNLGRTDARQTSPWQLFSRFR